MQLHFSEELLLTNATGSRLYHTYAEHLPIIDYHCHLLAKEIWENKPFEDLGEMWLAHDHYKWRAMRTFGIGEHYITGGASYYEKYLKFAEILPLLIGNPLYIWCALELKRYFDIDEPLTPKNAQRIYQQTKEMIAKTPMTPRWCMERSKVESINTTEDPIDSLQYHIQMKNDPSIPINISTAFRPDQAFGCEKPAFASYMPQLAEAAGCPVNSFESMLDALEARLGFFAEFGTTVSDHAIDSISWEEYTLPEIEAIYQKAVLGHPLSPKEVNQYKSAFMIEMGKRYHRYGFVMQLHIGAYRDANSKKVREIGQATGFDCVDDSTAIQSVGMVLNRLTELGALPKAILYPLNPAQMEAFAALAAGFCDGRAKAAVQLGAPWWFNDQVYGIERQFQAAGNLYPVCLSVGMLTDSRSFLSYPRHELYRRVFCNYLGELMERGEYFSGEEYVKEIIEAVCYRNAKEYFQRG